MFEVMVTFRGTYKERPLGCYRTSEEARERARQIALQHHDRVIRAWVRAVRGAKAKG